MMPIGRLASQNDAGVKVFLEGGEVIEGDVLIGADGIWSQVPTCRSTLIFSLRSV